LAISTVITRSAGERSPSATSRHEALLDEGEVHGDPGLGGEGVDHRLDQPRLPGRVDVDIGQRGQAHGARDGGEEECAKGHLWLQPVSLMAALKPN
jgi:hypothetical protein